MADNEKLITGQPGNILKNEAQAGKDTAPCWPAALNSREGKGQQIRTSLCNTKRLPERDHRGPEVQCSCRCLPSLQNGPRKGALRESVLFTKKEKKQMKWPVTSTFLSLSSEKPQRGKFLKIKSVNNFTKC